MTDRLFMLDSTVMDPVRFWRTHRALALQWGSETAVRLKELLLRGVTVLPASDPLLPQFQEAVAQWQLSDPRGVVVEDDLGL